MGQRINNAPSRNPFTTGVPCAGADRTLAVFHPPKEYSPMSQSIEALTKSCSMRQPRRCRQRRSYWRARTSVKRRCARAGCWNRLNAAEAWISAARLCRATVQANVSASPTSDRQSRKWQPCVACKRSARRPLCRLGRPRPAATDWWIRSAELYDPAPESPRPKRYKMTPPRRSRQGGVKASPSPICRWREYGAPAGIHGRSNGFEGGYPHRSRAVFVLRSPERARDGAGL